MVDSNWIASCDKLRDVSLVSSGRNADICGPICKTINKGTVREPHAKYVPVVWNVTRSVVRKVSTSVVWKVSTAVVGTSYKHD